LITTPRCRRLLDFSFLANVKAIWLAGRHVLIILKRTRFQNRQGSNRGGNAYRRKSVENGSVDRTAAQKRR